MRGDAERVLAVDHGVGLVSPRPKVGGERAQDRGFVVDHQYRGSRPDLQLDNHRRAAPWRVFDGKATTHRTREAAGDGKPEPDAGTAAGRWVIESLEGLKDTLPVLHAYALAAIDDTDQDAVRDDAGLDLDRAGAVAVGEGVVDEVRDDPLERARVGLDGRHGLRDVDDDVAGA